MKYIVFVLLLVVLAFILTCQTVIADRQEYLAVALCPRNTDCYSVLEVYPNNPADMSQIMYYEDFQYPPDVYDWQSVPENGVVETKALGIAFWSPDGIGFGVRLWGQQYKVRMPMIVQ